MKWKSFKNRYSSEKSLSLEDFEETARIHWYPFINETIAKLKPVFPDVVSMIVSPGFRIPFFSALSIMCNAILSFEEWPGLNLSATVLIFHSGMVFLKKN